MSIHVGRYLEWKHDLVLATTAGGGECNIGAIPRCVGILGGVTNRSLFRYLVTEVFITLLFTVVIPWQMDCCGLHLPRQHHTRFGGRHLDWHDISSSTWNHQHGVVCEYERE